MKNILVVGSINMDLCIRTERMPALGETIVGHDFASAPGGKGANQAVAMARLGANVKMLGAVGRDANGERMIRTLTENGVDCAGVKLVDAPTGTAVITVCRGDNCIIIDHGANALVSMEWVRENEPMFRWADIVVFQFEIPQETILCAARLAKENGAVVVLNPAPVPRHLDPELLRLVDILIPNEHEAAQILGVPIETEQEEQSAVRALAEMGSARVIITLGSRGSILYDGVHIRRQGIFPAEVVDTTAAGDSFIGGVCAALCRGQTLEAAVAYATAVSALTVGRAGAIPALPTPECVEHFLDSNHISLRETILKGASR